MATGNAGNPNPEPHPENLKPIKPGEVRNPTGKNQYTDFNQNLIDLIREKGAERAIAMMCLRKILEEGDFRFYQDMVDRANGKAIPKEAKRPRSSPELDSFSELHSTGTIEPEPPEETGEAPEEGG